MEKETLILKAEELEGLMQFVNKIPTEYGMPIKLFFIDINTKRQQEKKTEEELKENVNF